MSARDFIKATRKETCRLLLEGGKLQLRSCYLVSVRCSVHRDYGHLFPVHWVRGMEEALNCSCIFDSIPTPSYTHQQHMLHHPPTPAPASLKGAQGSSVSKDFYTGGVGGRVVNNQKPESLSELIRRVFSCTSLCVFLLSHFGLGAYY